MPHSPSTVLLPRDVLVGVVRLIPFQMCGSSTVPPKLSLRPWPERSYNRERDCSGGGEKTPRPMPKDRKYQSAVEILTRPATDLTLRGAANQIAMAEIKLSPIDNENAGR